MRLKMLQQLRICMVNGNEETNTFVEYSIGDLYVSYLHVAFARELSEIISSL